MSQVLNGLGKILLIVILIVGFKYILAIGILAFIIFLYILFKIIF